VSKVKATSLQRALIEEYHVPRPVDEFGYKPRDYTPEDYLWQLYRWKREGYSLARWAKCVHFPPALAETLYLSLTAEQRKWFEEVCQEIDRSVQESNEN
jgi:hypothetical protein